MQETLNDPNLEETVDIADSEIDETEPLEIAADRRRVKTDKLDVPIETIHGWVKRGKLNLQPEFQRYFVWNKAKASRLIESLLMDIPIPVVYVAEEDNKGYSVVDGQQRLSSICSFIDGQLPDKKDFKLSGLQVLTELQGKAFKGLDDELQETILDSTLRLIAIEKGSDPNVKFEVFERLNLGSVQLNAQELRNCMYRGPYNRLLKELAGNTHLKKILGSDTPHPRMQDCHLILRFLAMWRKTHLKYKSPMKQFLNKEMEGNRFASPGELAELRATFEKSIAMAYTVFGNKAFRRFNPGNEDSFDGHWEHRKLNVALWDTLLYTFSYYEKPQIIPIADQIHEEFLDLMTNDHRFVEYITASTDKPDRVQYRADKWKRRLESLLGGSRPEPRAFSLEVKQQLYESNPTCQICGQRIHAMDDAEVDHIEHYWRGGKTIPENARLTHRFCNRARGGRD